VPFQEVVHEIADRLGASASAKLAYGEPIQQDGRTVIPVAKVRYGFGGGGGKGHKSDEGGGGGGGLVAQPVGVIEISAEGTRFIEFFDTRKIVSLIALGMGLGLWLFRRRS
jgi:uncharacterized spore protein YtfJ